MTRRTRSILVATGLAALLGMYALLRAGGGLEVDTERVGRDSLRVTVNEEGRTRTRDRYAVAAPTHGRLSRIALREGDAVNAGAPVARIFPLPEGTRELVAKRALIDAAEARQREATARVTDAEARTEQLRREVTRSQRLADAGALSAQALERDALAVESATRQLEAARAALRAADADVAVARAALMGATPQRAGGQPVVVTAPIAGRIFRVLERSERVVPAGTPLIEIGDARGLEVVVEVLSEDAVRVAAGNDVLIEEWGGSEALRGRVQRVEPDAFTKLSALGVEEQRVNVIVDLLDTPPSLGTGFRVEARIVTWQGSDVLTVPVSALFQLDGSWRAFVVANGRAALRNVGVGHRAVQHAEVLEGLVAGDEVIVFPSDAVTPGARVTTRRASVR